MNIRVVKRIQEKPLESAIKAAEYTDGNKGRVKGIQPGAIASFRGVDNQLFFGVVKSVGQDGKCAVTLTLPGKAGLLLPCDTEVDVDIKALTLREDLPLAKGIVREWHQNISFDTDTKAPTPILEDGIIVDYRDVKISGYASTFASTTPEDRDGDYIQPGAFDDTIAQFMQNPVMLFDHQMSVENLVGKWDKLSITPRGLAVEGTVSNSPYDDVQHIRFLIAEKILKTLSIGGLFLYGMDGHAVEKIDLWEISLVAIPANPDATFTVRAVDSITAAKQMSRYRLGKSVL